MSLAYGVPYESYPPSLWAPPQSDPKITSLVPATSVVDEEVTVRVLGSGFNSTAEIKVDGAHADSTTFVSATEVTGTFTPTVAGTKRVTVRNVDDKGESNDFTYTVTAAIEEPEAAAAPAKRKASPKGGASK